MRLNMVVFPAPFGPIMAKISPSSTLMSTALTAVSPPNRLVSPRVSSSGIVALCRTAKVRHRLLDCSLLQLDLSLGAWNQSLRSDQHDDHQDHAEDQNARPLHVAGHVDVVQETDVERLGGAGNPTWQLDEDVRLYRIDHERPDDHASDISHPPEHHHQQDCDRHDEAEGFGRHDEELRGIVAPGKTAERGAQCEGQELR